MATLLTEPSGLPYRDPIYYGVSQRPTLRYLATQRPFGVTTPSGNTEARRLGADHPSNTSHPWICNPDDQYALTSGATTANAWDQ